MSFDKTSVRGHVGGVSGGGVRDVDFVEIPELRLGAVTFSGVPAMIQDLTEFEIDGLINFGLFHHVLFTIVGPRSELRLERGELPDPTDDPRCVALLEHEHPVPYIWGSVDDVRALILIDSGFDGTFLMAPRFLEPLDFRPDPALDVAIRTWSSVQKVEVGQLHGKIKIGPCHLNTIKTIAARAGNILVGGEFLRERVVTFDQVTMRVRFASMDDLEPVGSRHSTER